MRQRFPCIGPHFKSEFTLCFTGLPGYWTSDNCKRGHGWGASWEGFALEEIIRLLDASEEDAYFWGVHSQGELDLLIVKDGKRLGFEFKYSDSPKLTPSCRLALDYLNLDQLTLVCPGNASHELEDGVRVAA